MFQDLRHAWRSLRKSPTFTATAVLSLAIGLGGSTAIFSLVNAVLLRPLPFRNPGRLAAIWESNPAEGREHSGVSASNFNDWRQRSQAFEDLALFTAIGPPVVLGLADGSIQVREAVVTPNLFSLLGVRPVLGREFGVFPKGVGPLDGGEIIISHALWQSAFGGDETVIGRTVRIEGAAASVIVGVMPPRFSLPPRTDVWVPTDVSSSVEQWRDIRAHGAIARLKPLSTIAAARAELKAIAADLAREHPASNAGWTTDLMPLRESIVGHYRLGLITLFAATACVLLVGCANLSNLLLARGTARRNELAVRTALGASRGQIAQLLFTESAVLAVAGAIAGWLVAKALLPFFIHIAARNVPRLAEAQISGLALVYCAVASISTVFIAGLLPAVRLSCVDLQAMKPDGERSTRSGSGARLQRVVVAVELALCLVLLVGATLFIQTFIRLRAIDLGFDPEHVISIDARVPMYRTMSRNRWQLLAADISAVLQRLRSIPGVQAVSVVSDVPLSGTLTPTEVTLAGQPQTRQAYYHRVSPDYFRTMGMTLLQGRDFNEDDVGNLARLPDATKAPRRQGVVIVNETTARTFWPAGNAVGQFLSTSFDPGIPRRQVVGIVRDARSQTRQDAPPIEVYVPYLEDPSFATTLLIRTTLSPDQIVPTLRREIREVSPDVSTANIRMLDEIVSESMGSSPFRALVVSVFGAAALVLAAVGVFGVFASGVASRIREIGIRMAIGATPGDIARMFLKEAAVPIGVGVLVGVGAALALGRFISSLLFGVAPTDPISLGAACVLLVAVALTASYWPVRRALQTDPARALRS